MTPLRQPPRRRAVLWTRFLYAYIRREAVLSSQIEGAQSTLADLLLFELEESPGVPFDDVVEVSGHVAALEHGVERLREGFPLSNRLIREMHAILLSNGRGSEKSSGEFRRTQNWIGGTRPGNAQFVPPPLHRIEDCIVMPGRPFPSAQLCPQCENEEPPIGCELAEQNGGIGNRDTVPRGVIMRFRPQPVTQDVACIGSEAQDGGSSFVVAPGAVHPRCKRVCFR